MGAQCCYQCGISRTSQAYFSLLRYLETGLSDAISLGNTMIEMRANGDILNLVYQFILCYSMPVITYAKWNTNYILHFCLTV